MCHASHQGPPDSLFGLIDAYNKDPAQKKVNVQKLLSLSSPFLFCSCLRQLVEPRNGEEEENLLFFPGVLEI